MYIVGRSYQAVCPMKALKLVHEVPTQLEDTGYDVNLRQEA